MVPSQRDSSSKKKATTNAKKMHKDKIKVTEELRTNLIGETP